MRKLSSRATARILPDCSMRISKFTEEVDSTYTEDLMELDADEVLALHKYLEEYSLTLEE